MEAIIAAVLNGSLALFRALNNDTSDRLAARFESARQRGSDIGADEVKAEIAHAEEARDRLGEAIAEAEAQEDSGETEDVQE